jgi:hypothetical protein
MLRLNRSPLGSGSFFRHSLLTDFPILPAPPFSIQHTQEESAARQQTSEGFMGVIRGSLFVLKQAGLLPFGANSDKIL